MVRPRPCRQKSPSRFDLKKLENLNGHYMREADDARLAALVAPQARPRATRNFALLIRAMPELKARAHDLNQLADGADFLFATRPLAIDDKAAALLTDEARAPSRTGTRSACCSRRSGSMTPLDAAVREVAETQRT